MISRRALLELAGTSAAAAALLSRCRTVPDFALSPWHMWGNSVVLHAPGGPAGIGSTKSNQIVKINYARPETWSFWFGAKVLGGSLTAPGGGSLRVFIDIMPGIGRSLYSTDPSSHVSPGGFAEFRWQIPAATVPVTDGTVDTDKWTTSTRGPVMDESEATPFRPVIDHFPAQDLQCVARAILTGFDPGDFIDVDVHAYFAPRTHIRPEWFRDIADYRGGEQEGT